MMAKAQDLVEKFMEDWNGEFPNYALTVADLKKPHALMGALFKVLDRLGIDREAVLAPPSQETMRESTYYYWDLLPVINMTRVIHHLVSVTPQDDITISMMLFLQPTVQSSHSILLLLFNLMVFNDERLRDIEPYEKELFAASGQVRALEERKNKLLEMLNKQAEENAKRGDRVEKLNEDIKQLEEELKQEKMTQEERQELETILKENAILKSTVEQKKTQRDAIMAEVARKKALRVYDADDIQSQHEQATQNVQEAEDKLNSLRATLMQKENSLKNLQTIKPSLDQAKNLLHEIMDLTDSLKESENGDLDTDSKEGELDVLNTEIAELKATLAELQATKEEFEVKRQEGQAKRHLDKTAIENALREAIEKDKQSQELCKQAAQRTEEIKQSTYEHNEGKLAINEQLANIEHEFTTQLKLIDETLLKQFEDAQKYVEEKLQKRGRL